MRIAGFVMAVVAGLGPGPACAGAEDDLVALINDYRAAPTECQGRQPPMAAPLSPSAVLADVVVDTASELGSALSSRGHPVAAATLIVASGPRDATEAFRFVAARYCEVLADSRYSEIGVSRERGVWRLQLARPLLPADLGDWRQAGKAVLRLANEARARPRTCGTQRFAAAPPLGWSEPLASAAVAHSTDMAERNYFRHADPAGRSVADRATRAGYRWRRVGENIASGLGEPAGVVAGWLASPGHCANLMDPGFAEMGAAYATKAGSGAEIYWTQTFGSR
jgi:uncharacterized protein YkwD